MYAHILRATYPFYETRLRGRATLTRLAELERSQWRTARELEDEAWQRMQDTLRFAEERVPYYRRRFAEYGVSARTVQSPDDLRRFPVLTKRELRAHRHELLAEGFRGELFESGSSGSTGEPVRFVFDHRTYELRIAAAMRADGWAGARLGDRELHVWAGPVVGESRFKRAKRRVFERVMRRWMISPFELSPARMEELMGGIAAYRPGVVIGYVTPLFHLARFALERGFELPRPRGIVATAERVFDHQRETLERAFGCRVFDRYGCREVMLLAAECERHEGKHLNAENVYLELYRGERAALPGEPGEVILTDLQCRSMPLIRYKNGDVATASAAPCSCGRGLPVLASVEGRVLDMIVGPDGKLLAGEFFPQLLKEIPTIERFQVRQDRPRAITVHLVPSAGFSDETPVLIVSKLRSFLGADARIDVRVVQDIPLTRAGKHRHAVSEVPVQLEGA